MNPYRRRFATTQPHQPFTRATRAISADVRTIDLAPSCPDCGDIAHPTATVCEACGAHLYPSTYQLSTARPGLLSTESPAGQKEPIMAETPHGCTCAGNGICVTCVLAEYNGDSATRMMTAALDATPRALDRSVSHLELVDDGRSV